MSTIDINNANITGDCNLKCSYSFDYQNSSTVATNTGFSVSLTYDKANVSPVIYNANKYEVSSINIYAPSIHTFDGSQAPAEIVIFHKPSVSGSPLAVAIPFIPRENRDSSSLILAQIISAVTFNAPASGESTNINTADFNLNDVVPGKTPFFSYTANNSTDWIVFSLDHAIILEADIYTRLTNIIDPPPSSIIPESGPNLFYNSFGSVHSVGGSAGDDQIYIDCQPVTTSSEVVEVVNTRPDISFDLMNNPTFMLILSVVIGCLLFIIFFFAIYNGIKYFLSRQRAAASIVPIIKK